MLGRRGVGHASMAMSEVKIVYEQFSEVDDVVVWGINRR